MFAFHPISKHRIGYGAGYYDRYLRFIRKSKISMTFIGIALE